MLLVALVKKALGEEKERSKLKKGTKKYCRVFCRARRTRSGRILWEGGCQDFSVLRCF